MAAKLTVPWPHSPRRNLRWLRDGVFRSSQQIRPRFLHSDSDSRPECCVACQDMPGQSSSRRGHVGKVLLGAGAPFFTSSLFVCAGPALGNACILHPPATAPYTMAPTAACDLIAVMLGGTGTFRSSVEAIETCFSGVFSVGSRAESAAAGCRLSAWNIVILCMRLCVIL